MNYAEYFNKTSTPKWNYGDRIFGKFSGVPLIGMVIREIEKDVLVHADLPIRLDGVNHSIVRIPMKGIKRLVLQE